jgi:hypothetical protein
MDIDAMQFGDGEGLDIVTRAIMARNRERSTGREADRRGWIVSHSDSIDPVIRNAVVTGGKSDYFPWFEDLAEARSWAYHQDPGYVVISLGLFAARRIAAARGCELEEC